MRAFWWFKENSIAGMARPGFNDVHWLDLPFEEALVFGWFGQRNSDTHTLASLKNHVQEYGAKILSFHGVDQETFDRLRSEFNTEAKIIDVVGRVKNKTKAIDQFEISGDRITFSLNKNTLRNEMDFLKERRIGTVVTLTENHNQRDELADHFYLHHLSIEDLNAPSFEQAAALAEIIKKANLERTRVAVHCMAGIGRTSTMLLAAHLILGEDYEALKTRVARQNPCFKLTGAQGAFVESVAHKMRGS